jgi:class 3 adenylate cyclase/tetratricopeptide (TPR) repeat protein
VPDRSRYCLQCGVPLAAPSALPEERRIVTILFCDITDFTGVSEDADAENVDRMLRRFYAGARRIIELHGGVVEKYIGDAVVGVFGVPRAHDDDPERAVRAGLQLVAALRHERVGDHPVLLRGGVNTGEAYVRLDVAPASGESFLTGDTVNTAARLQAASPPGGIVVGERTYELTRLAIDYVELEPFRLKGKREPVRGWLARAARGGPQRTGRRASGEPDTPFLGRREQLHRLLASFDRAASEPRAHSVLVIGEPGIGKSRLVLEFARILDVTGRAVVWRHGRCLAYGDRSGLSALSDIVKAHAGVLDSDDVASLERKLDGVLPEDEQRPWLAQRLRPLLGLDAAPAPQAEAFAAWAQFLRLIALQGPAVVVVEDLHWAGDAMLAFFEHLDAQDLEVPLLVVATTRPELLGKRSTIAAGARMAKLKLAPLSRHHAARLVSALTRERLASNVRGVILDHVGGNPLYAEEYVRLLRDRGLLLMRKGVLHLKEGGELPVPGSVHAVLAARIDTLPPRAKALLCDGAVFGETFWEAGVAELSGCSALQVRSAMTTLAGRELIRPVRQSSLAGETEHLFWHAIVRDAAYVALPMEVRARKHAAAARWIEAKAGRHVRPVAEVLAHHYVTALGLREALQEREQALQLVEPARRYLTLAGDTTLSTDVLVAEHHFGQALALEPMEAFERGGLLVKWGESLMQSGRLAEAAQAFRQSADLLVTTHPRQAAVALMRLCYALRMLNDAEADTCMARALAIVEDDECSPELVAVLEDWASVLAVSRHCADAIRVAERAMDLRARLGLPESCRALHARAIARCMQGDEGGLSDYEHALRLAAEQELGGELCPLHSNMAEDLVVFRGPREALEANEKGMAQARRRHDVTAAGYLALGRVAYLTLVGRLSEALVLADDCQKDLLDRGQCRDLFALCAWTSLVRVLVGNVDRSVLDAEWIGDRRFDPLAVIPLAAVVQAALGREETAVATLRELDELSGDARADSVYVMVLPFVLRAAAALGRQDLGDSLLIGVGVARPYDECVRQSWRGVRGEWRELYDAACRAYGEAAAGWHELGMPYERAQALWGRARCLVALEEVPQAVASLREAREVFSRCGTAPAERQVSGLLTSLTAARG